ncbi:FAD-dependent oxidoreductase [Chlorella sorokiniana]|uniref:FAD-dependent oxidoreductase n=1 Tax=Chlorella sorokiniana TaxID=3076 RepID=A0A2P6TH53_CHLSO|nr:FAD-dependent oxidoreductase [Chlorella sorokiniana]|eukprot:PRW33610.1 FAD-dependent oxidoreductase [Chlorella sorokiniana]
MSDPQAEPRHELVVVGAGMAALHLVARLPDSLLQGMVVVDPSGAWLTGWEARRARLAAPHMRTPNTQHPHASPLALMDFAVKHDRQQELVPVVRGFAPVPSTALFSDFCRKKVISKLPAVLREPLSDTVVRLESLAGESEQGCRVHLASGRTLLCRAAIYTPANRRPVLPAWVRPLLPAVEAGATGGLQQGSANQPSQPQLPPGMFTADTMQMGAAADLGGKRLVVIGGGMSAGLLAAGAAERGARVHLVCRRPLKPQPFETEVGWWGAKHLNSYRQVDSAPRRIAACRRARGQGTVHLPLWRRLAQLAAAGRLTVLEGYEVAAAERQGAAEAGAGAGVSWVLTLRRSALAAGAAPEQAAGQPAAGDAAQPVQQQQLPADQVWLACGAAYNAAADPVLADLAQQAPAPLTGGYPWLDDESLCWPGAPVFLLGRGTLLSVGPSAGDLPGMRLAADRVAAALRKLDYAGAPLWQQAQRRLLSRLTAPGDTDASAGASGVEDETPVDVAQLTAAVAAAAAAAPAVPLEEDGVPYVEPKPKVSVSKPDNLIDVSDLDPDLPRKEVQQYKFTDDDFEICVICQLEEGVPLEQVRTRFGTQSLEMWAVGEAGAYRLYLPRLYGKVLPHKCHAKVNQKARKVYLLLHKESDAEWRFLKS